MPVNSLSRFGGLEVVDACAAPGSKTSQLAVAWSKQAAKGRKHRMERCVGDSEAMMSNEGTIYAFDRDAKRLKTMTSLLERRHVTCVEAREKDLIATSAMLAFLL